MSSCGNCSVLNNTTSTINSINNNVNNKTDMFGDPNLLSVSK